MPAAETNSATAVRAASSPAMKTSWATPSGFPAVNGPAKLVLKALTTLAEVSEAISSAAELPAAVVSESKVSKLTGLEMSMRIFASSAAPWACDVFLGGVERQCQDDDGAGRGLGGVARGDTLAEFCGEARCRLRVAGQDLEVLACRQCMGGQCAGHVAGSDDGDVDGHCVLLSEESSEEVLHGALTMIWLIFQVKH